MTRHSLPQSALSVIDAYWRIQAPGNGYIRCPYFRNPSSGRDKWGLTVYSGKGTANEIEIELKIIEKLEGRSFSGMQEQEIRDIMEKRKLGIECSGFIVRVLDAWTNEIYRKPLHSFITFNARGVGRIFSLLRPYTHIDVKTLVHSSNAQEIQNFHDLAPGDILYFSSEIDHAALITATARNKEGGIEKAWYAHSVLEGANGGIKQGLIEFTNSAGALPEQKWSEEPNTGITVIQKGAPSIRRLHIIKDIVSA